MFDPFGDSVVGKDVESVTFAPRAVAGAAVGTDEEGVSLPVCPLDELPELGVFVGGSAHGSVEAVYCHKRNGNVSVSQIPH
jgi:hypothetical protein